MSAGVAARIVAVAEAKTVANAALGTAGMVSVFVKGILCNWLVCLGVVMAMTSTSTVGKIAATWLPIFTFFALGFEHTVVNMFIIPTGMLLGAKVSVYDWWVWNQIPVTLGNLVGGFVFTGLALYTTYKPAQPSAGGVVRRRAGGGRITVLVAMKLETPAPTDFSDEQKRYLEGFMSGLQVSRVGRSIGAAGAARRARRPTPSRPDPTLRTSRRRTGSLRPARSSPTRRSSSAKSIRSTPMSA